jgi:tetratricopeptide (TPR) repeat protein
MNELPTQIHNEIKKLSALGDSLAQRKAYREAISEYNKAWEIVPEPKNNWEASTWLLAAIGDACFLSSFFKSGSEAFGYAITCPGGLGNPFLHLRLGQCHFELGNLDAAADELCRAYMGAGSDIFLEDNAKYFAFLKTRIEPPASGVW